MVIKIDFQLPTSEIKQLIRKIKTKSKQVITTSLHQEYIYISCMYVYIIAYNRILPLYNIPVWLHSVIIHQSILLLFMNNSFVSLAIAH